VNQNERRSPHDPAEALAAWFLALGEADSVTIDPHKLGYIPVRHPRPGARDGTPPARPPRSGRVPRKAAQCDRLPLPLPARR
jgi:hypothetical protein